MAQALNTGLVIHARSGRHEVQDGQEIVFCRTAGRLKRERLDTDLIATGDWVRWRRTGPDEGVIEEVLPRRTQLNRRRPGPGRVPFEQVIVANPDQAVFIFSIREPEPHFRLLDRLLVIAEANDLPVLICAHKADLASRKEARHLFEGYDKIGYPVLYTSTVTGQGVRHLRQKLQDRLSVLCGPSGSGKSSLLNTVEPQLGLATQQISESTGKGRHTTVSARLWPLRQGGYVADTPGLREAGFYEIDRDELSWYFVEFRPYLSDCRFSSCTHTHEPGCAVIAAVEAGKIGPERHDSYCRLFAGE